MSPDGFTVVDLLKLNKIHKVQLFDTDPSSLRALMGSGIEVMVGIPNHMLYILSSYIVTSDLWVRQNVSRYLIKGGANIRPEEMQPINLLTKFFKKTKPIWSRSLEVA